jgi:hypothetical protein
MEACPVLFRRWNRAVGTGRVDECFPVGQLFVAPIQPEVDGKTHEATARVTRDGIGRKRIRIVAMIVMAIDVVAHTAHRRTQGIIEAQRGGGLRTADFLRLLEERGVPTVIDLLLEPGRRREEARQVGFVSTRQDTASDVGEAFVVQDDQPCQVMLEMVKLAPVLKDLLKGIRMSGHYRRGCYDGKLHQTFTLSRRRYAGEGLRVSR